MLKTKEKHMQELISNQMEMNKTIAAHIGSDERTAFMNATNVKQCLSVPVNEKLFINLVSLCHRVGFDNFSNSLALKMVNTNHSKARINKYLKLMS